MTTTLKSGTRPLQLGVVTDLKPALNSRDGSVDIPNARGSSRQDLGSTPATFTLTGTFTGSSRFDYFQQLDRHRMVGRSLKLESQFINTVAYITNIGFGKVIGDFLGYNLALKESLFKSISDCEDQVGWYADSGEITNEYDSPEPKEGDFYLKNSIVNGDYFELSFEPSDPVDLSTIEYLAFWFQVSAVTYINQASIRLDNDDEYSYAYFQSKLLLPNVWYRLLIHKSEFTNFQSYNFSQIWQFRLQLSLTANQTMSIMIDDFGVYE
jgi:hypothetical protein